MVIERDAVAEFWVAGAVLVLLVFLSRTSTVNGTVPVTFVVPEIAPVDLFSLSPRGSEPATVLSRVDHRGYAGQSPLVRTPQRRKVLT
jgi:hypothetical protein